MSNHDGRVRCPLHFLYRGTAAASRSLQTKCERAEEQDVVEEHEGGWMHE